MANFDTGNLVTAQSMLTDKYSAPEMRVKPFPALQLLSTNADLLMQDIATLRTREDRAVEGHTFARTKRAANGSRTHNHTGTIDDSQKLTLSWTSNADTTSISLKLLDNSVFDFNKVLSNKLEQCCINILEAKETAAIAYLRAQRATQQPTLKKATFNAGTDAIEVSANNKKQFYQILKSVMRQNYFQGLVDVVADASLMVEAEYLAAQGGNNDVNTQFQFQGMNIRESVELDDANYNEGCVMAFPAGSVGALHWIPKQNRTGRGDYNSVLGGYGVFSFLGYTFAFHAYTERANTSASNGNAQDDLMQIELSIDTSLNKAPLNYVTNRTDSVIMEFAAMG